MSLNIPKAVVDACSTVTLGIDTDRLGPRQLKAAQRMVQTGVTKGFSLPTMLAIALRRINGVPTIRYGRYSRFHWYDMPYGNTDFFDRLKAASVAMQMDAADVSYRKWQIEGVNDAAEGRHRVDTVFIPHDKLQHIMKTLVLPPCNAVVQGIIYVEAKDILP